MARSSNIIPRTVKEIFNDFKGRRMGLIKALTVDVDKLHRQCDPATDNSYLIGLPDRTWEVVIPFDALPPKIPEPLLGINFTRDGMKRVNWLTLIATSSDSWLLSVAFFYAGKAGFGRNERNQLFEAINDLPTVYESLKKSLEKLPMKMNGGHHSSSKKRAGVSKMPAIYEDEEEEEEEEEEEDSGDEVVLCGSCNKLEEFKDHFWIYCDFCRNWFHGDCVMVNAEKAKSVGRYRCPRCCQKRARV